MTRRMICMAPCDQETCTHRVEHDENPGCSIDCQCSFGSVSCVQVVEVVEVKEERRPSCDIKDVRAYADETGVGVILATRELKRRQLIYDIQHASSIEDLRSCLLRMI